MWRRLRDAWCYRHHNLSRPFHNYRVCLDDGRHIPLRWEPVATAQIDALARQKAERDARADRVETDFNLWLDRQERGWKR